MQDQTGKGNQHTGQNKPHSQYGGWDMSYIPGPEKFMNNNGSGNETPRSKLRGVSFVS
ncbi:MAG: hypothetical protein N2B58_01525 [Desulfobacterales bacterium]|jgi:hypothetical protein